MFEHSKSRIPVVLMAVGLLVCWALQPARAVTFFKADWDLGDPDPAYADIVGDPDADPPVLPEPVSRWGAEGDPAVDLTYKFDASFTQAFPSQVHHDAVRYAFDEWETATGPLGLSESYYADYSRWGPTIYDMKTIALHELGHGMGLGHPFMGSEADLNFRYGDYDVAYDGTQEWAPTAHTGFEVMGYGPNDTGLDSGVMNRFLGWDEINGSRYSYGPDTPITFTELDPADPAAPDILVMAENLGPTGTLAWNELPGGSPTVQMWNSWLANEIGTQPSTYNAEWDLTLFSGPAYGIALEVAQSSDADVMAQRSYTTGNHYLENYDGGTVPDDGATWHTWTDPSNNHPLVGETSVGLKFDKETWGVTQAVLLDINSVPGASIGATSATAYSMRTVSSGAAYESPLGTWAANETILEQGITLRGTPNAPMVLTRVLLADVTDMDLGLADLNSDLLEIAGAVDVCVPCLGEIVLGMDEIDHVLLFSDGSNLTPEMLADPSVEYHLVDKSYLLTFDELLVIVESEMTLNGEVLQHRSYNILGQRMAGIADQSPLLAGDVDNDGFVGGNDLSTILANWGRSGVFRPFGDLTGDGFVGASDYTEVLARWGTGGPPEAVPEPAVLSLLLPLAGGLIMIRRPS